jgi:hypothetical protein
MGLFDSLSGFLKAREGDFIKLEQSGGEDEFGPGPLILLYNIPSGIGDDEVQDIIQDGAPTAHSKGCRLYRVTSDNKILDFGLANALELVASGTLPETTTTTPVTSTSEFSSIPVLFFSGFRNKEMMAVYNILGQEIYQETGGQSTPACAKAVSRAMQKPLGQVLDEITGDHQDAMKIERQ